MNQRDTVAFLPGISLALLSLLVFASCRPQQPDSASRRTFVSGPMLGQFERKKTCYEVGRYLYEAEFKSAGNQSALKPLYAYSRERNSCVIYAGLISENGVVSHFLLDTLSNTEIASSIRQGGSTVHGLSQSEFEQVKSEFFPEDSSAVLTTPEGSPHQ